jgi:hypothetical protein
MHDAKWLFPQAGAPKERSLLLGEEEKATLYEPKKVYVDSENALERGRYGAPCSHAYGPDQYATIALLVSA